MSEKRPTEREFDEFAELSLKNFANRIRASGMSLYKIAHLSGVSWKTVQKATERVPIRFDNAERIKFVLCKFGNCKN